MSQRPTNNAPHPAARLYLVTPMVGDPIEFAPLMAAAVSAGDVAAVLLRLDDAGDRTLIERIQALAPAIQKSGAALLLDGRADLAARSGADGAHLAGIDTFTEASGSLKPDRIAGCGGLATRHDAMIAAERGADYVMFGEPDGRGRRPPIEAIIERVAWWAEVFEPPCVAYAAALDEIAPLAAAGADFVALGDWIWRDPRGAGQAVAQAAAALKTPEPAA